MTNSLAVIVGDRLLGPILDLYEMFLPIACVVSIISLFPRYPLTFVSHPFITRSR
jgi:hypothetical protein